MVQKEEVQVSLRTSLDASGVTQGANRSEKAMQDMARSFDRTADKVGQTEDEFKGFAGAARRAANAVSDSSRQISGAFDKGILGRFRGVAFDLAQISTAASGVISAFRGVVSVIDSVGQSLFDAADGLNAYAGVLEGIRVTTESTTLQTEAFAKIVATLSLATGSSETELAKQAARFTALGVSQEEAARALRASVNVSQAQGIELEKVAMAIFDAYKGSVEQASQLGINVAGLTNEELKRGAIVERIEESMGRQIMGATDTTIALINQRETSMAITRELKEMYENTYIIREAWGAIVNVFKNLFLDVLQITNVFLDWINRIIPLISGGWTTLWASFYSGVERAIIGIDRIIISIRKIASIPLGLDTTELDNQLRDLDARAAKSRLNRDEQIADAFSPRQSRLDKRLADLSDNFDLELGKLNRTNRQIFESSEGTRENSKDIANQMASFIRQAGDLLAGDDYTDFSRLSELIDQIVDNDKLNDELIELFRGGLTIDSENLVNIAQGDPKARAIAVQILAEQIRQNELTAQGLIPAVKNGRITEDDLLDKFIRQADAQQDKFIREYESYVRLRDNPLPPYEVRLADPLSDVYNTPDGTARARENTFLAEGYDLDDYFRDLENYESLVRSGADDHRIELALSRLENNIGRYVSTTRHTDFRVQQQEEKRRAEAQIAADQADARREQIAQILSVIAEGVEFIGEYASRTVGRGDIAAIRADTTLDPAQREFQALTAEFENQQVGIEASQEIFTQAVKAAAQSIDPIFGRLAAPLIDLFLLEPDQVDTFFKNLGDGLQIVVDRLAERLPDIVESFVLYVPEIATKFAASIVAKAPDIAFSLAEQMPYVAYEFVIALIGNVRKAQVDVANAGIGIAERFVNKIGGFLEDTFDIGSGDNRFARFPGGFERQKVLERPEDPGTTTSQINPRDFVQRVSVVNPGFDEYIDNRLRIEGEVRSDNVLTAAEAFNPYTDSGYSRQRQPIRVQINIGNQRLRDILTDLDETGYIRTVTA